MEMSMNSGDKKLFFANICRNKWNNGLTKRIWHAIFSIVVVCNSILEALTIHNGESLCMLMSFLYKNRLKRVFYAEAISVNRYVCLRRN